MHPIHKKLQPHLNKIGEVVQPVTDSIGHIWDFTQNAAQKSWDEMDKRLSNYKLFNDMKGHVSNVVDRVVNGK